MDAKQWQNEAVFLASAWLLMREKGLEYVLQHGDPDGVDFVAKRVLDAANGNNLWDSADTTVLARIETGRR